MFYSQVQGSGLYILFINNCSVSTYTRSCDSHNINVSPFCILDESSGLEKWAEDVKGLYKDMEIPDYLENFTSLRNIYGTPTMKDRDMFKTLNEVTQLNN